MISLNEISSSLIDIKKTILKLEKNTDKEPLQLNLSELQYFWEVSKIDSVSFEKQLRNQILETDKSSLDIILSCIKSDLNIFLNYYNKNSKELDIFNKDEIVKYNLTTEEQQSDYSYEELKIVSAKYFNIYNKLDNKLYKSDSPGEEITILKRLEKHAKKEYEEFKKEYNEKFKHYRSKSLEYNTYTFFEFKEIHNELSKCLNIINSIQNRKNTPLLESENIVSYELIGIAYRLSADYFAIPMSEKKLGDILNLKESLEEPPFKHGQKGNFHLIIKNICKILELDNYQKSNWETDILKSLSLELSTHRKGSPANKKETLRINNAFKHLIEPES